MEENKFPMRLFLLYIVFYSGQAIQSTYLNLYLAQIGFSKTMIGLVVSLSTMVLLFTQPLWGIMSDRAKKKNTVLQVLYISCVVTSLFFYGSTNYLYVMIAIVTFTTFFNAIMPLQDNLTLEYLDEKQWDFGHIRMGGTIGYAITVAVIGFLLKNQYSHIFWIISLAMLLCFVVLLTIPPVQGYRRGLEKAPFSIILKNKPLICLIAFNVVFSLGSNFYHSFYPIYFESIGGDSSYIGMMMFASAASEIPFLLIINKLVKKWGVMKLLLIAAITSGIRWFLLYLLTNPILIILVNLLHGFSFISFMYCLVVYINTNVPKSLRATGQTFNNLVGAIFSRVIFGVIGGIASDLFGINSMMLVSAISIFSATVLFALIFPRVRTSN